MKSVSGKSDDPCRTIRSEGPYFGTPFASRAEDVCINRSVILNINITWVWHAFYKNRRIGAIVNFILVNNASDGWFPVDVERKCTIQNKTGIYGVEVMDIISAINYFSWGVHAETCTIEIRGTGTACTVTYWLVNTGARFGFETCQEIPHVNEIYPKHPSNMLR